MTAGTKFTCFRQALPSTTTTSGARRSLVRVLLFVLALIHPAWVSADDIIWDGGGADNNWDTAENWSNDVVPTFFENVFFTSASSKDCVITQNQVVFDFTMTAGYAGTLSSSGNPSLTIANDMSVEGGSINWISNLRIIVERDLAVSGGSVTMASDVIGNTTITAGTVDWRATEFTGDVLISGGSVTWNSVSNIFLGDYTRTGGTVDTTNSTNFSFSADAPQVFTVGAGGITLRSLQVRGGPSQVLDITGDIAGTGGNPFDFQSSSTTNLNGTLTLNSSSFQVRDSLTTFNVLDGSVVDATGLGGYGNQGMINEIGTGKVLRAASLGFTDSAGAPVGSVPAGTEVFITLFDEDENIDGTVFDTAEATVTSLTTGDVETITVTETGTQSEEFRNTAGLPTAAGTAILGDGILQQDGSEDLLVSYTDDEDPGDTAGTNLLAPPIVWDGGGADNNWDTAENWSTDTVPVTFTSVLFDATSSKNCVVTQNQQVLNFTMTAGYAGTLSDSGGRTLTINGDMLIDGGTITWNSAPPMLVSGDTTITGGTVNWRSTRFTGDVVINGGTVTWGTSGHDFRGDYIRTGGTVNTTTNTQFRFNANAPQAFTVGAGGIALRFLTVVGGSSEVLDITGDITINPTSTSGSVSLNFGTTNLDGTLTLNPGTDFTVSGSLSTLNVLDGSAVDTVLARSYRNDGMINEIGTGVILRNAGGVGFTDSAGTPVESVPAGTPVFITLFDEDENIDGTALDTVEVTVGSLTTGDVETITLSETFNRSEEFRDTTGLPTAAGTAIPGDGILQQNGSEDLLVTYIDDEDTGDTISNNLLAVPIVWDGGGADNNWDTPENWNTDRVPTLFDSVIFDGTSSKDAVVTLNQEMSDFTMTADYTGTVTDNGDPSLTINGQASIEGGTFDWRSDDPLSIEGNLDVSGGTVFMRGFGGEVLGGTTTITGGTITLFGGTDFTGDVLISGGSLTWRGEHDFRGDYIRTGGAVTAHEPEFNFKSNGPQAFTIGAGGITLRSLRVSHGPSQALDITGDITFDRPGRFDGFFSSSGSTTNLDGRLTLNSENTFSVLGSSTTFNVLDGSVLDATAAGFYINEGVVNEIGTGKVLRFTTGVGLTESTGMIPVNKIDLGDPIFLLLFDEDENIRGNVLDTAQITLTNLINGDFETVTLTERGGQSEDFFFAAGFPTAVGTAIIGNGILEAFLGNVIQICYQDDEDPADVLCVFKAVTVPDCNGNGVDDLTDIADGTSDDCDDNGVPDECQLPPIGDSPDCNNDQIPDLCQILNNDCNNNGVPDDCESFPDCNNNGEADACDIFNGDSADCNNNDIPDECESPDCDNDGVPDECEPDCDSDGTPDDCEVDCNNNGLPDNCETFPDCNANGIPDECEPDTDGDNVIDDCEACPDDPNKIEPGVCGCGVPDEDSDGDTVPDCIDQCPGEPDVDSDEDGVLDCNDGCPLDPDKTEPGVCGCGVPDDDSDGDGVEDCIDACPGEDDNIDCNENGTPDACDIAQGDSDDCNENTIPDECEEDSDGDGVIDECDSCFSMWGGAVGDPGISGGPFVYSLKVLDEGSGPALYVGGAFTQAGGVSANRIARWSGSSWSALGEGLNNEVWPIGVFDDGNGEAIYVSGAFTEAGGMPANHVAKWDGSSWSALGDGLNNGAIALVVFDDGTGPALYAGGIFTEAGGAPANYIAKWDGTSWSPVGGGTNGAVFVLHVVDDGTGPALYAGGPFWQAGGQTVNYIAKWDGTSWSALGSGMNHYVYSLTGFDDGSGPALYAGGRFTLAGGVSAVRMAKWDGNSWSALGSGMNERVYMLETFDDGNGTALYAAGRFTTAGGLPANYIAQWDGQAWWPLGSGTNHIIRNRALTVFDDGCGAALYAGGDFTAAGGVAASLIARWGCVFDDCNDNGVPDACGIAGGIAQDCNENGIPDECDIADGSSEDNDNDGVPDECNDPPVAVCREVSADVDEQCCVTVSVADVDDGSSDPNGGEDIDTLCITAVDGNPVGCQESVEICDDGTFGPHTVTLTITDLEGESDSCIASVIVVDGPSTPPDITCPPDQDLQCPQDVPVPDPDSPTATDNCDDDVEVTFVSDSDNGGAGCPGDPLIITRTYQAVDDAGNISLCDQAITMVDTTDPVLTIPADVTIECDEDDQPSNTGQATATDNCDGAPSVTFSDSVAAGECPQESVITRTWTATDACGNAASLNQVITVVDTTGPVIACPDDLTVQCDGNGNAAELNAWLESTTASDICGGVSIDNDFAGLSDDCGATGTVMVIWTATDDCGHTEDCSAGFTIVDTMDPAVDTCPAPTTVECDGSGNTAELNAWLDSFAASDICGDVTLTNDFDHMTDDCAETGSATIAGGTPPYTICFAATDDCGLETSCGSCESTFVIEDTAPPVITCPDDLTVECDGEGNTAQLNAWLASTTATDECGEVSIADDFAGLSDDCGATGTATVTWTATDDCGNTEECSASFTIVDTTEPVIDNCPAPTTVECDGSGNTAELNAWLDSFEASDMCGDVTLTNDFDHMTDDCAETGSATIAGGTPPYTVCFAAADDCGLETSCGSCESSFVIEDTTPPVIACPDDATIISGDPTDPDATGSATASDVCDQADPTIVSADQVMIPDCLADPVHFVIAREWTATDDCGLSSSCVQTITVLRQEVSLIIKQGACPAPVNPNSNGVVPMLLTGDTDFDVNNVLLGTLRLTRCDCTGGDVSPIDGPPGPKIMILDLNHPFDGDVDCVNGPCACNADQDSDGLDDIWMKFRTDEMVSDLPLVSGKGTVILSVTGDLDASAYPAGPINVGFIASDCILIVPPGADPINATVGSNVADTYVEMMPLDLNVDSDGFTNFGRAYFPDTLVTVTAPPSSAGRPFLRWKVDGVLQVIGLRTLEVEVTSDVNLEAIYRRPSRIEPDHPSESDGDME